MRAYLVSASFGALLVACPGRTWVRSVAVGAGGVAAEADGEVELGQGEEAGQVDGAAAGAVLAWEAWAAATWVGEGAALAAWEYEEEPLAAWVSAAWRPAPHL